MTRALATTLLLFAAILAIAAFRYSPPSPLGADVAPSRFSAARAREVQRVISADGAPRDLGSATNERARTFLEAELAKSGFHTEIQRAMACTRHGSCARVANVVATRAGREPGIGAVLLMAHYDSVPCGPGASDDGMGISTAVETARALGSEPPLRRTVVIVLTDGEEAGLLGADAFVRQHPLAASVRAAVNVDSRGSSGPSAMFETSPGNAWIIGLYARAVERPVTSSLFYEIYRRMPNDTDFTSVKDAVQGVNFANIARIENYHTPLDTFENADPGTLQHHGDQALAMVRALGDAGPELEAPRARANDAVWFDVLTLFVVRWPAAASLGLALAALALVLGWTIRMRAWGAGLVASLAALVAAAAAGLLAGGLLRVAGAVPVPWVAHPLLALTSLHSACILAGLAAARLVARRARARAEVMWAGTWLTWGALGVAVAVVAPGACFLFVVPTFVAGFVAWLRIDLATAIPAVVAAVLWVPIALLSYDGLGLAVPILAAVTSVVLVSVLPALAPGTAIDASAGDTGDDAPWRRFVVRGAAVILVSLLAAIVVPKYSAEKPQRVNVVLRQDTPLDLSTPPAHVYVEAAWAYMPWGTAPAPMLRALGDPALVHAEAPMPWSSIVPFVETPRLPLAPPAFVVLAAAAAREGRNVRVRLSSPRGARTLVILLPAGRLTVAIVENVEALPRWGAVVLRAVPPEGIEVGLHAVGQAPIAFTLFDVSSGLPAADVAPIANAVRAARPREATQTQEGDITIVSRQLEL